MIWDLSGLGEFPQLDLATKATARRSRDPRIKILQGIPDCAGCGRTKTYFRDEGAAREFQRSGTCQRCQDQDAEVYA